MTLCGFLKPVFHVGPLTAFQESDEGGVEDLEEGPLTVQLRQVFHRVVVRISSERVDMVIRRAYRLIIVCPSAKLHNYN